MISAITKANVNQSAAVTLGNQNISFIWYVMVVSFGFGVSSYHQEGRFNVVALTA